MRERVQFDGPDGAIICDTRQHPYVLMRPIGSMDPTIVDRYTDWQRGWFADLTEPEGRCVWISDIHAHIPSPALRRHIGKRRGELDPQYSRWVIRELVIVDNSLVRGVFTFFHLVNPRLTFESFATLDKALDRGRALLHDAGVDAPRITAAAFADER